MLVGGVAWSRSIGLGELGQRKKAEVEVAAFFSPAIVSWV